MICTQSWCIQARHKRRQAILRYALGYVFTLIFSSGSVDPNQGIDWIWLYVKESIQDRQISRRLSPLPADRLTFNVLTFILFHKWHQGLTIVCSFQSRS